MNFKKNKAILKKNLRKEKKKSKKNRANKK